MKNRNDEIKRLRLKAEAQLLRNVKTAKPESAEKLLHELQVYQIELEMQNENLRQTQLHLEESRDRYQDLYDFAPVGYLTLNKDGLICEINLKGARLLGSERKLLLNTPFARYLSADESKLWCEYFRKVKRNGHTHSCELKLQRENGEVFHAQLECLHIGEGESGHTVRISLTNISARKNAEAKMAQSRQLLDEDRLLFQAILDNAPIGIWMLDANRKIRFINKTFCESVGTTEPNFLAANHYSDLLPETVSGHCIQSDNECLTQETPHLSSEWLPFVDGKMHLLEITKAKLRDYQGNTIGLIGLAADITERHRIENELKEYQQLLRELADQRTTAREAELKHLAREVHDELGQLLTALRMDISLLRIQFGEHNSTLMVKIQDMLLLVDKAIGGVRDVTANLRPPALDLGIAPAIVWLGNKFSERTKIACKVHVKDEPVELNDASILTLFRIVQESLTNITRHAEASLVEINLEQKDGRIYIEICDDGVGFDIELMSAKNSFGMMGMKERALAVGGRVDVSSFPSQGTVISVQIPVVACEEKIND